MRGLCDAVVLHRSVRRISPHCLPRLFSTRAGVMRRCASPQKIANLFAFNRLQSWHEVR
jgi:hypothetical protein